MRAAVEKGVPMQRALATLPPADENRPVSLNSRRRRNAARVYVEEERAYMGLGIPPGEISRAGLVALMLAVVGCAGTAAPPPAAPAGRAAAAFPKLVSTEELARWQAERPVVLLDVRTDVFAYLKGHLPGAEYLNTETLRASEGGIPTRLLSGKAYRELFARLGVDSTGR